MHSDVSSEHIGSFVRNSFLLVSTELMSKVMGLVFFIVMARYLGAGDLGVYAFTMTLANFFALAPKFGFERHVQKEVGRTGHLMRGYFYELTTVKAIITMVALGALAGTVWITSPQQFKVSLGIAVFVLLFTYLDFVNSIFRALRRAEFEVLGRAVFSVLNLSLGLWVLWSGGRLLAIAAAQSASAGLAIVTALVLLKRFTLESSPVYSWRRLWERIRRAAPLAGVLVALYFSNQVGVLILGMLRGDMETGYFAAAMRLFDNLTVVAAALMGAFLPSASDLYVRSRGAFSQAVEFAIKHVFLLAAPVGCGLAALAEPITRFLYGPQFSPAVQDLRILGGALIVSYMNYVADSVLIATDREKLLFRITCLTAVIHVASNFVFVYLFSHAGAAIAVIVTQLGYLVLLLSCLKDTVHMHRLLAMLWRPMLFAAAMGVLVHAIQDVNLVLLMILGAGFYSVCLVAGGVVPMRQVLSLGDVLLRRGPGR